MTDIDVTKQSIQVAVADLDDVSSTLARADGFVHQYLRADTSGGLFLTNAGAHINDAREELGHQYRDLSRTVSDASDAVMAIWKDFRDQDEASREKYEAYRQEADGNAYAFGGTTLLQSDGTLAPAKPPAVTPHPAPSPASRRVDLGDLQSHLDNPDASTGWIETLNTWRDIKDGIDKALAFEWMTAPLSKLGIHVPLDKFKNHMEGNYEEWAESIAAMFALADYFDQVHTDMEQVRDQVAQRWLGSSSVAVQEWLGSFASAADFHRGQLNAFAGQVESEAILCKMSLDQVIDLLGDLSDFLPVFQVTGDNLIEKGIDLLSDARQALASAVAAAIRLVVKIVTRVELLWTAAWAIITLLSSAPNDLRFPEVTRPAAAG